LARLRRIRYVDSHTEGEPTRVIVGGGPDLGSAPLAERRERFRQGHDDFRRLVIDPPRGSSERVGALLVPPRGPSTFGTIFFNNVGTLGMCGHGSIGVAVTLAHLGEVPAPGRFALETPVGPVRVELHSANEASITNVASFRHRSAVRIDVPAYGPVVGDVAWGGNWFFLLDVGEESLRVEDAPMLIARTEAIRSALQRQGVTGRDGAPIDHIELSGAPARSDADSRNFVLCPGGAYDRSPCGTGTSAKMACLYADHRLKEGELWRQEGILGTRFVGTAHVRDGLFTPIVRGRAYITNEGELVVDPADPLLPRP
jgi:4-hydroxyproline epimerase